MGNMMLLLFLLVSPSVFCERRNATGEYDATELLSKIFSSPDGTLPRAHGLLPQHADTHVSFGYERAPETSPPLKFEDTPHVADEEQNNIVKFQDTRIKKKRRRKQKQNQYLMNPLQQNTVPLSNFGGNIAYRPQRRPTPSIASQALITLTEALTSIARYDDYQCVPRLLCESVNGGALGSSQLLQSVSGLQPLLTLLSAYDGVSTNPLFVFGRAVLLGMSSKGSPASCRSAYPLCPTDTEQLVHYLNNHNGGFFRFFNSPQQQQQNFNLFNDQLSQNYNHYLQQLNHNYYGINEIKPQKYGLYQPNLPTDLNQQGYGLAYPYNDINKIQFKTGNAKQNKIERRIQNKPQSNTVDTYEDFKWKFPDSNKQNQEINLDYLYDDINENNLENFDKNIFKFPEISSSDHIHEDNYDKRKNRGFAFPKNEHMKYVKYKDELLAHRVNGENNDGLVFGNQNNRENVYKTDIDTKYRDDRKTVYIVRGNGDPNNPEVIMLKPGQTIQGVF